VTGGWSILFSLLCKINSFMTLPGNKHQSIDCELATRAVLIHSEYPPGNLTRKTQKDEITASLVQSWEKGKDEWD
jgi:hypothetical protein